MDRPTKKRTSEEIDLTLEDYKEIAEIIIFANNKTGPAQNPKLKKLLQKVNRQIKYFSDVNDIKRLMRKSESRGIVVLFVESELKGNAIYCYKDKNIRPVITWYWQMFLDLIKLR